MKLKHFRVGCFSLCLWCLFTDGVLQGSDGGGRVPSVKQSAGKNQHWDLQAFAYGTETETEAGVNFLCQKVTTKRWFCSVPGVDFFVLWYHQTVIQLYIWQSYLPDDWSTSKSVYKHLYRKSSSQKAIYYILPLRHSTSSTQIEWDALITGYQKKINCSEI